MLFNFLLEWFLFEFLKTPVLIKENIAFGYFDKSSV